jgi:hypothetical protein
MRVTPILVALLAVLSPSSVAAQSTQPAHRAAVGGDVGFLAPDNGEASVLAVKSEMSVHILSDEADLPELRGNTLTAFTWTFGLEALF